MTAQQTLSLDRQPINEGVRKAVRIGKREIKVSPVFSAYWHFAAERQRIFFRRLEGSTENLTDDPVLQNFKFTNTYRASDRVSQFLIKSVIYRDDLPSDLTNQFFRILLFKLFNKIETWNTLEDSVGPIVWEGFSFRQFDKVLSRKMARGERIYSAAYIMPSAGSAFGHSSKHQNHLRLVEHVICTDMHSRLADCKRMSDAYALLRTIPSIGPFLAYQFVTDFNYSEITQFAEDEFVVAGPGALDGIHKCFVGADDISAEDIIRYVYDHQEHHFGELGIEFQSLWGRRLQLIDCQNVFCEISKYARAAFPEFSGIAGRTRIKQKFQSKGELPSPWYPPKWNLNCHVDV